MSTSSTKSIPPFDAEKWVRENLRGVPSLRPKTLKTVTYFTFLWNLFEGLVCKTNASIKAFKRITQNLASSPKLEKSVNKSLSFYRDRYVEGQEMKPIFDGLCFRCNDKKEHVKAVLKGEMSGVDDKVLALLIIAYRIRNNLFHGLKSANNWDNQAKNISEASRILSIIIKAKRLC